MQCYVINLHGISLDVYQTPNGHKWVTLTSLAKGLGVHRQTVKNWINTQSDLVAIRVKVGARGINATAYPINVCVSFILHLALRGNGVALSLLSKNLETYMLSVV